MCQATHLVVPKHEQRPNSQWLVLQLVKRASHARPGMEAVDLALNASVCSRTINTSFVERQHGTDRHRYARKARKSYRFSRDRRVLEAMTYFALYSCNFCWPVRTLRTRGEDGCGPGRSCWDEPLSKST
jgi:hypothetical protein